MLVLTRHCAARLGMSLCVSLRGSAAGALSASLFLCSTSFGQSSSGNPAPEAPAFEEQVPPASNNYSLGPDSLPQASVAKGSMFTFDLSRSEIFPQTVRKITVFIPATYQPQKPACLYVGLDGLGFNAATVFDNLIAKGAMPVTIAIGISPGVVPAASGEEDPRFDRSLEFDSRSDRLARFLLDEVIPQVEAHQAPDGRPIRISKNPDDRAIGGASTGGIGAFTVAWERPDAFHRVFSAIGTYVGMRGGEQYYVLVRKTDPKPLRIFMQDGVHDEWPGGPEIGDWWMANQTMNRALEFAGYDVQHVWGIGTHNPKQAEAVFPDAMRWLWRGWPTPVQAGTSHNPALADILEEGNGWQEAAAGCTPGTPIASDPRGRVYFWSGGAQRVTEINTASNTGECASLGKQRVFAFGPDNSLYSALDEGGIEVLAPGSDPVPMTLAKQLHVQAFTVRRAGEIDALTDGLGWATDLWLVRSTQVPIRLAEGLAGASGLAFTPDARWLFVAQATSRSGLSFRVLANGELDAREPFYDVQVPTWAHDSGAGDVRMDRDGRAYVATRMGVQIFDRNGRVVAILPLPGNEPATGLCFGGDDFKTLYVSSGSRIYRRHLKVKGSAAWDEPIKLPPWRAG